MATTAQHNQIIKVVFDGNKHLKHVLSSQEIKDLTMIENRFPLTKLPVCGHCEKLGLWSQSDGKPIGICKSCGSITKSPITYSTYLASKMDVDQTGDTFRSVDMLSKKIDDFNRKVYLHKFNMGG
jgi:hypothetical protein